MGLSRDGRNNTPPGRTQPQTQPLLLPPPPPPKVSFPHHLRKREGAQPLLPRPPYPGAQLLVLSVAELLPPAPLPPPLTPRITSSPYLQGEGAVRVKLPPPPHTHTHIHPHPHPLTPHPTWVCPGGVYSHTQPLLNAPPPGSFSHHISKFGGAGRGQQQ